MEEARFSYERGEGFVTYDPRRTKLEEIVAELKRMTGFDAVERETMEGDHAPSDGAGEDAEGHAHESEEGGDASHR